MIIPVQKIVIFGFKNDLDLFFRRAQEEGFLEIVQKTPKKAIEDIAISQEIAALKLLKKQPYEGPQLESQDGFLEASAILSLHAAAQELEEKKKMLIVERDRLAPLGDFPLNDVRFIEKEANFIFQFLMKKHEEKTPLNLIFLKNDGPFDYFLAINRERKIYPKYVEIEISKSLAEVKEELTSLEKTLQIKLFDLHNKGTFLEALKTDLTCRLNIYNVIEAQKNASLVMEDLLFSCEAWVPEIKKPELEALAKEMKIDFVLVAKEVKDREPTYMENQNLSKLGEDLVNIYDTPSPKDKDPSLWVLFAFSIFYAMIISDAGYGFCYLLLALFLKWKKFSKIFTTLTFVLGTACLIWGGVSGNYFGCVPPPTSSLSKATPYHMLAAKKAAYHMQKKDDVYKAYLKDYPQIEKAANGREFLTVIKKGDKYIALDEFCNNIFFDFAILFGCAHIIFSFLRYIKRDWSGLGWICFIIGGYLYFPSFPKATTLVNIFGLEKPEAYSIGMQLLFLGLILAAGIAIVRKKLEGLMEIVKSVSIFGDVLSYLRLYALGLAAGIMAATCNELALGVPLVFGIIIILFGHILNFSLGIMGGVIHGLRLNFIEWYHYCFEGDGKLFRPLKLLK